jgi:hypothetical protein
VKGRTGWTKKPRGVNEEHHGPLKRLLGCLLLSTVLDVIGLMKAVGLIGISRVDVREIKRKTANGYWWPLVERSVICPEDADAETTPG